MKQMPSSAHVKARNEVSGGVRPGKSHFQGQDRGNENAANNGDRGFERKGFTQSTLNKGIPGKKMPPMPQQKTISSQPAISGLTTSKWANAQSSAPPHTIASNDNVRKVPEANYRR